MRPNPSPVSRFASPARAAARTAALAVVLAAVLAACASDPPAAGGAGGENGDGAPAPVALSADPAVSPAEYERILVTADRLAGEVLSLADATDDATLARRDEIDSALVAFATEHVERLLAGAADPREPARRVRSVRVLGFSRDRRATAVAVAAIETTDPALQNAAGFALARLRDMDTPLDPILAAAQSPDADVRVNALLALYVVLDRRGVVNNFRDPAGRDDVLGVLATALFDPADPTARAFAAAAAGALGDPRAVEPLLGLLQDRHPFVRTHTAIALGKLGNRAVIEPLLDVIDATPPGAPRTAVLGAIELLLEREHVDVPRGLGDDAASWREFVRKSFVEKDRRPLR